MAGNHQRSAKRRPGAFSYRDSLIVLHIIITGRLPHIAQPIAHIVGAGKGQNILLVVAINTGLKTRCRVMQAGGVNTRAEQSAVAQAAEPFRTLAVQAINVFRQQRERIIALLRLLTAGYPLRRGGLRGSRHIAHQRIQQVPGIQAVR
ncbi:hypothetical protein D3C79_876140 [compost metagenome]